MKKKIIIIISICLLIIVGILISIIRYKSENNTNNIEDVYLGGVESVDFSNYSNVNLTEATTITSGGIYTLTGDINGTVVVNSKDADVKLVLSSANITSTDGPAIYVEQADNVYIELVGNNTINSNTIEDLNGAIYSKDDLCILGDGSLKIVSNIDGIVGKDDLEIESGNITIEAQDDGIVGKDSVYILNGTFNITVSGDGIKSTNDLEKGTITILNGKFNIDADMDGIQSMSYLTIEGGTFNIKTGDGSSTTSTSNGWGFYQNTTTNESMKGIKSSSDIKIINGTFTIDSEDDSIHANGNVTINGGTFNMSSGDDGIHSDKDITINNGTINITKSYEGVEGANITVSDGNLKIVASDDGFNAAGGDGSSQGRPGANNPYNTNEGTTYVLSINGGTVYVNAAGDGLDSNGNIFITGGYTTVDGPTNNGNGPIDYGDGGNYKFEVTGGTLIAVGSQGMAVSPTSGTTVTTLFKNTTSSYNGTITFGDITYSPAKSYNSILICSNKLEVGKSYDLKINNTKIETITLSNTVTTSGTTGNMGGPGGGDHGGGPGGMR